MYGNERKSKIDGERGGRAKRKMKKERERGEEAKRMEREREGQERIEGNEMMEKERSKESRIVQERMGEISWLCSVRELEDRFCCVEVCTINSGLGLPADQRGHGYSLQLQSQLESM